MAISDTLSDAAEEIREFRRLHPDWYGDVTLDLDQLLEDMDALRIKLDTAPKE